MFKSRPLLTALICLPLLPGCTNLRSFELDTPAEIPAEHGTTTSHAEPAKHIEEPEPAEIVVADPLLTEWTKRYEIYTNTITDKDYKTWEAYIAPSFVWTKGDGTKVNRADALKEFGAIFQAKTITGTEKVINVTEAGGLVNVELHVDLTMDFPETGEAKYEAYGTDIWKEINGKWLMVKSIDKPAPVQPAE